MTICEAPPDLTLKTAIRPSFAYRVTDAAVVTALELAEARTHHGECALLWMHIDGSEAECRRWLSEDSGLPEAVIQAMQATETRPRATQLEHGAIVNLRGVGAAPECDAGDLVSIRLYAEHGRVLTSTFRPLASLGDLRACFEAGRITDPGDFIAALADTLTARLDPLVSDLGDAVDVLEEEMAAGRIALRDRLSEARRTAIELRRYIAPQHEAIGRMASGEFGWLNDEDRGHIRESGQRIARMSEELDSVRERSAVLADQLSDLRAESMNQRTLVLSIVAAIFLPLTFLTGLFGMNVGGIPFADNPAGFWWMAGISTLLGVALVLWFRRQGWFD